MFVDRFFVEGLAHASYLFGRGGEAAVVDPKRDVQDYLAAAERRGVRITAIFETHPHADFISGHMDLAAATGAPVYVSERYAARFPHVDVRHGQAVKVGGMDVVGLDTPGHSPDSMSFYAEDGDERIVFSGDILFVGDVGRPDLRDMHADPRAMAEALYDTLHGIFWKLPDDTVVYPAHGAGSLCGRKLGSAPSTTIGRERAANWANEFATREAFVDAMLANLPDRPFFFYNSPFVNLAGPRLLSKVPHPPRLDPAALRALGNAVVVIDTRGSEAWAAGHIQGSLSVGLDLPLFSTWVGSLVRPDQELVLVVEDAERLERAWLDLARIGYECIAGHLTADVSAWRAAGLAVRDTPRIEGSCLDAWLQEGRSVIDVRTPGEWQAGALEQARRLPLSQLPDRLAEAPGGPTALLCGTGYRSSIAASLLERAGRTDVVDVRGGWAAYAQTRGVEPDGQDLFCRPVFDRFPVANRGTMRT